LCVKKARRNKGPPALGGDTLRLFGRNPKLLEGKEKNWISGGLVYRAPGGMEVKLANTSACGGGATVKRR